MAFDYNDQSCQNLIVMDSAEAMEFGFTSDKFEGCLWRIGRVIYIARIVSKQPGRGHLSRLIDRILECGYILKVPTPLGRMQEIVRQKNFTKTFEYDPECETFEVWVKIPP